MVIGLNSIRVHFVVSYNSIDYLFQAIKSYSNLCSANSELSFNVYALDKKSFKILSKHSNELECDLVGEYRGSVGHALGLERAIHNFDLNCTNVLSDTDIMVLKSNWDLDIKEIFETRSIDILGTQHEKVGGFISGNLILQQYKKLPSTTWLAVRKGLLLSNIDLKPSKSHPLNIDTVELSHIYNLPIGYQLFKDTGWQIPVYLREHSLNSLVLDLVKPTDEESRVLKGEYPYHDEFHLDGNVFLAHQRGSMSHIFRQDPLSRGFYDACDRYLEYPKWSLKPSRVRRLQSAPFRFIRFSRRQIRKFVLLISKSKT